MNLLPTEKLKMAAVQPQSILSSLMMVKMDTITSTTDGSKLFIQSTNLSSTKPNIVDPLVTLNNGPNADYEVYTGVNAPTSNECRGSRFYCCMAQTRSTY